MSAATHSSPQTRSSAVAARPAMRPVHAFVSSDIEEDFRLHLADIPRHRDTLDVEGLKPTLLSRLLDLVTPVGRR